MFTGNAACRLKGLHTMSCFRFPADFLSDLLADSLSLRFVCRFRICFQICTVSTLLTIRDHQIRIRFAKNLHQFCKCVFLPIPTGMHTCVLATRRLASVSVFALTLRLSASSQVRKVTRGTRYVLAMWFTCSEKHKYAVKFVRFLLIASTCQM